MGVIRTAAQACTHELEKIRGSRFIGDAGPASDVETAMKFIESVREREPGASHHCFAWRLDDAQTRTNDDGEPAQTAGEPILRRIVSADVMQTVVVVTRYYGGTKLGAGGLIRAYGGAAAAVLDVLPIRTERVVTWIAVHHEYDHSGPVAAVLNAFSATAVGAVYDTDVRFRVAIPEESADDFCRTLKDATAGRATIERCAP